MKELFKNSKLTKDELNEMLSNGLAIKFDPGEEDSMYECLGTLGTEKNGIRSTFVQWTNRRVHVIANRKTFGTYSHTFVDWKALCMLCGIKYKLPKPVPETKEIIKRLEKQIEILKKDLEEFDEQSGD